MKKLINNVLYDTATSTELCIKRTSTEYNKTTTTLYKSPKGSFLKTIYTIHKNGNVQADSLEVVPEEEAKTFYAAEGDTTKWKDIFGEEVELG